MSHLTYKEVKQAMMECEQTPGLSVLDHGKLVYQYYQNMEEIFIFDGDATGWRIPKWLMDYADDFHFYSDQIIWFYTHYHDCGKPYVLEIDADGKRHFPNHAEKSYQVWKQIDHPKLIQEQYPFFIEEVGQLILHDMDLHLLKADQIDSWLEQRNEQEAITLLLIALCEVHANAEMWGGIDSVGFKIKWKQINKRGNQICQKLYGKKS